MRDKYEQKLHENLIWRTEGYIQVWIYVILSLDTLLGGWRGDQQTRELPGLAGHAGEPG